MRRYVVYILLLLTGVSSAIFAARTPKLITNQDKVSYALGVETGRAFKNHDITINPAIFSQGLKDGMSGNKTILPDTKIKSVIANFQKQTMSKALEKLKVKAAVNLTKSNRFLAENKKKSGVVTLPNGLQYKIIKSGSGAKPKLSDTVIVNYEGKLVNGKVFDSSYKRGRPATFKLNQVITGWQQALQRMRPGAVWMVFIPPKLAYGARGVPGAIGPNQALIFKVNLISIKK